jgi:hypothetical protein
MALMTRAWPAAVMLVLWLAGCGGGDENTARVTSDRAQHTQAADVGDPPTLPPARFEGEVRRPPRPTVIASGQTARGDPFEVVLYGTTGGLCISTLLPARKLPDAGAACGERILPRLSTPIFATGSATLGRNEHEVSGFVSPDVDSVVLSFELEDKTQTLDAVTEQLPQELLEETGAKRPLGVFVAFLSEGVTERDVTATAYDSDGNALGTATWFASDQGLRGLRGPTGRSPAY